MDEARVETMLTKLAKDLTQGIYTEHQPRKNNVNFGDVLKAAREGMFSLETETRKNINQSPFFNRMLQKLSWQSVGMIPRGSLLSAAGSVQELNNIPSDLLHNFELPSGTTIISEKKSSGYSVRVESSVPTCLTLVFLKEEEEIYRAEVSEEIPEDDELIPISAIEGWTDIRILQKVHR